jgi:protein-S-isoprenylcysteine O-methyltransferase Ste14
MSVQTKVVFSPRVIAQLILIVLVVPFLPMIVSGSWLWWEAWMYALVSILGFIVSRMLAARRHPDILAERARSMKMQDAKAWDKILAPMLAFGNVLILIVAGLDHLFGWTTAFPMVVRITAIIMIIFGYLLGAWALVENRFFSVVVRIQKDRGQHVVSSGPYRFIRHPGYTGFLAAYLFTPLFLDSIWALIPTLLLTGVLVLRTALEDKTLQEELPGYKEFARKTRYRLIPGIW